MRKRMKLIAAGLVLALGSAGFLLAAAGDDSEPPITGEELQKASAAALAHTGGGTVTDTEVGDEESYYEVEVTLEDGSQVDVQLDKDFNVVGDSQDEVGDEEDDD